MDVIGNTLEEIAFEKSGVIKAGAPCVIGPTCSELLAIKKRANDCKSPLISIGDLPNYNMVNSKIVAAVLDVICRNQGLPAPSEELLSGVASVS